VFFDNLKHIPCKDASPEGDDYDDVTMKPTWNRTRWTTFKNFLDKWEDANEAAPLETQMDTATDIKYLRKYGCDYLKNSSLWDSMDSHEAWLTDVQKNKTVKSPYWYGRNLCVRGRGHKPLSFFCPEACGCHRGDEDCPLTCPEREATTPICPAHQQKTYVNNVDGTGHSCHGQLETGYCCPRHPRAYSFDVGFSSVGTSGTARAAAAGE